MSEVEIATQISSSDRLNQLEKELQDLKKELKLSLKSEETPPNKEEEEKDREKDHKNEETILVLQDNIFNGFLLLYYNGERWSGLNGWDQFRVCIWLIVTMIMQVCCVGLLCGLLIHKGYHNSPPINADIPNEALEVLAFLLPAVLGAGFIFVYDEVRRPLIEMINYHNHSALTIVGWCNLFGFVKIWEVGFGLLGSWAYFISLIYSCQNTLHEAQGFIDIILNMLAYVFVFQIDEWAYSMIAIREFIPQWDDDIFQVKATESTQPLFKMARRSIKLSMCAIYILVLVLWFTEFYKSR